jgi:DNA primase
MSATVGGDTYARRAARVDVEELKQAHPIQDVVARYGIELRRQGRAFVGRCPFHIDHGRPNLHVWSDSASWWCFRCNVGGDTIRFVELAEGVTFREAIERLAGGMGVGHIAVRPSSPGRASPAVRTAASCEHRDPEEIAVLRAATWLYHQRLLTDATALAYLEQRGLDRGTVEACRIGYAAGNELAPLLRWQHLPLGPALRVGLLTHAGREFLADRIVVPELRDGQPVWLVGRLLEQHLAAAGCDAEQAPPKYLALPGSKPLLGLEQARASPTVIATEGVFDLLTLRRWGYPCVALVGTHTRPDIVDQLRAFERVYLVLDQDDAGIQATLRLADALGTAAVPVALPEGTKDIAELAPRADGHAVFAAALLEAVGASIPPSVKLSEADCLDKCPDPQG